MIRVLGGLFLSIVLIFSAMRLDAGQPLETETARLPDAREFKFEYAFEYQTSSEGKEKASPIALEYGVTQRLELLVEPVFYTAIRPKAGPRATGLGDLEVTLTYLLSHEGNTAPALAVAGEVKLPTARNKLIGTGKTDYTGYFVVSKRFNKFDTHANIGYTVFGKPAGVDLKNIVNFAFAEEYHLSPRLDIVGEVLGNTSSAPGESQTGRLFATQPPVVPEATGGELVGMVGFRYYVNRQFIPVLGVSYDNNKAVLVRAGLTLEF